MLRRSFATSITLNFFYYISFSIALQHLLAENTTRASQNLVSWGLAYLSWMMYNICRAQQEKKGGVRRLLPGLCGGVFVVPLASQVD